MGAVCRNSSGEVLCGSHASWEGAALCKACSSFLILMRSSTVRRAALSRLRDSQFYQRRKGEGMANPVFFLGDRHPEGRRGARAPLAKGPENAAQRAHAAEKNTQGWRSRTRGGASRSVFARGDTGTRGAQNEGFG